MLNMVMYMIYMIRYYMSNMLIFMSIKMLSLRISGKYCKIQTGICEQNLNLTKNIFFNIIFMPIIMEGAH